MDGIEDHLKWCYSGSESQKWHVFSHMWNVDLTQACYEKQGIPNGGHIWERGQEKEVKKVNTVDVLSIQ
jgi:hypothetical protein